MLLHLFTLTKKAKKKGAPVDPQAFDLVQSVASFGVAASADTFLFYKIRSSDFPAYSIKGGSNGIRAAPTKKNERVLCEYQELYIQVQMLWKQHS